MDDKTLIKVKTYLNEFKSMGISKCTITVDDFTGTFELEKHQAFPEVEEKLPSKEELEKMEKNETLKNLFFSA